MIAIMTNPEEFEISKLTKECYCIKMINESDILNISFKDLDHLKELARQLDDFIKETE